MPIAVFMIQSIAFYVKVWVRIPVINLGLTHYFNSKNLTPPTLLMFMWPIFKFFKYFSKVLGNSISMTCWSTLVPPSDVELGDPPEKKESEKLGNAQVVHIQLSYVLLLLRPAHFKCQWLLQLTQQIVLPQSLHLSFCLALSTVGPGTARIIQADYGTENTYVAGIQRFICNNSDDSFAAEISFMYGRFVSNQRIECLVVSVVKGLY